MNNYKVNQIAGPDQDMEKRALDAIVSQMLSRIGEGLPGPGTEASNFSPSLDAMADNPDPAGIEDNDDTDSELKDLIKKRRR